MQFKSVVDFITNQLLTIMLNGEVIKLPSEELPFCSQILEFYMKSIREEMIPT